MDPAEYVIAHAAALACRCDPFDVCPVCTGTRRHAVVVDHEVAVLEAMFVSPYTPFRGVERRRRERTTYG